MGANVREIYEGKIAFVTGANTIIYVHSVVALLRDSAGHPLEQMVLTAPITADVYFGDVELPYLFSYANYVTGTPQPCISDHSTKAPARRQPPHVELVEETEPAFGSSRQTVQRVQTAPAPAAIVPSVAQKQVEVRRACKRDQPTAMRVGHKRQMVSSTPPSAPAPAPAPLLTDETERAVTSPEDSSSALGSPESPPPASSQEPGATHPLRVSWRYKERPARIPRKPWDYSVTCFAFSKAQYWN